MIPFNNRVLKKAIALFLLLVTIESIMYPGLAMASAINGYWSVAPEYTSYEQPGATDMVNLLTGDFTYSIPLLDVPGPDGNFSVPLTYNAGIGNEQESSWVGLGWTLNVGAITRQINQYPDDAVGDTQQVTVQNTGIRGWSASLPGGSQIGWNNVQGNHGTISLAGVLNFDYNNSGITSFNQFGLSAHNGTIDVNQEQLTNGLLTIATLGNPDFWGAKGKAARANFLNGYAFISALSIAGGLTTSNGSTTTSDTGKGYWTYNKFQEKNGIGFTNYWIWLDQTRTEEMYGTLYLADMPSVALTTSNQYPAMATQINSSGTYSLMNAFTHDPVNQEGVASDMSYYIPPSATAATATSAALIATDLYKVSAPGISGNIAPYRLDVGSLSFPREMSADHYRLNPLPYYNYKVPFKYESESYRYLYHTGTSSPVFNYGLSAQIGTAGYNVIFDLNDNIFGSQRIGSDLPQPPNSPEFPQSNHVEWISFADRTNATTKYGSGSLTYKNGFMDYFSATSVPTRDQYVTSNLQKIYNSIGGYVITGPDGLNYHFALPSFEYNYNVAIQYPSQSTTSSIYRPGMFANTWLLTGITGHDFVDRNNNGSIDDGDWGYWVKFNYYQYNDVNWRIPQSGSLVDPTNTSSSVMSGTRQSFYLNSVETRSHVAIFIKDEDYLNIGSESSLRLEEIALLRKSDYYNLVTNYIPTLTNTLNRCFLYQFYTGGNIQQPAPSGNFIINNAIKRIRFTHTYGLKSYGVQVNTGKRTLSRVSIIGSNGVQIMPDYVFSYGFNPNYNVNSWDGWGMYNSLGTSSNTSHGTSPNQIDGSAWSLSSITTPLGAVINVYYERDRYSSISGTAINGQFNTTATVLPFSGVNSAYISNSNGNLVVGDTVRLSGTVSFTCPLCSCTTQGSITGNYMVTSFQGTSFSVTPNIGSVTSCSTSSPLYISYSGTFTKVNPIFGGGIRVGWITVSDNGQTYKTRYLYQNDDGSCSGVVSQEPPYSSSLSFDFNTIPNYPFTPVLYSEVQVLKGAFTTSGDYNSKTVYQFETPNLNQVSVNSSATGYQQILGTSTSVNVVRNEISDFTSKIGALKSIAVYDPANPSTVIAATTLSYTNQIVNGSSASGYQNNYQGLFSSGSLMFDYFNLSGVKIARTTSIKYPYALQSVTTTKDGFQSIDTNLSWDIISGQVVEKNSISPSGISTKTVVTPAYLEYSGLGPKAFNIANTNMVAAPAASYVYKLDSYGQITGLISGTAQTWSNGWTNYRYLNAAGTAYLDDGNEASPNPPIWRPANAYLYKGSYSDLQPTDGTFKATVSQYNFSSGATNSGWQEVNSVSRYDHYSMPVETLNPLNGISTSAKRDFGNINILSSASNAKYLEFAYSGAEDGAVGQTFFGGEVALGTATLLIGPSLVPGTDTHTGQAAVQLSSVAGNKSFVYMPQTLTSNRTYRVSAWTNSQNGAIYYNLNNAGVQTVAPLATQKSGNWYQINAEINVGAFTSLEVGVTATSGIVNFDDFRFQPRDAAVTANVYDAFGNITFTLDNQNMFTQYDYNSQNQLIRTWVETFKNGKVKVSEKNVNYRRTYTN